jgi:hypothetical protein
LTFYYISFFYKKACLLLSLLTPYPRGRDGETAQILPSSLPKGRYGVASGAMTLSQKANPFSIFSLLMILFFIV